jgi:D-alanyl-D-alanine carboxypeptidase
MLSGHDVDGLRYTASLAKMMTALLVFDALRSGETNLNDRVYFSAYSQSVEHWRLNVGVGNTLSVRECLTALLTRSSNDVAVALAEHISGNEAAFVRDMNRKAARLGMTNTRFYDASGLNNRFQRSTARDMATLGRHIVLTHPTQLDFFAHAEFSYHTDRSLRRKPYNVNRLVRTPGMKESYPRVQLDRIGLTPMGMKTGFIKNSWHNLVALAGDANGNKIIAVGFGGQSQTALANTLAGLMVQGYNTLRREHGIPLNRPLPVRTQGPAGRVPLF